MKLFLSITAALLAVYQTSAFSLSMSSGDIPTRRAFVGSSAAAVIAATSLRSPEIANAGPEIYKLDSGIKYAITKDSDKKKYPQRGDIVAIEYTGYLTNGAIFDGTHSEGKSNALLFQLGNTVVIPGINEMVSEMKVGQKVQAIIPPELAFGDKGICLDDGECLVKPGSTLVYDIALKKSSIPPP
jgi:FKBP-type peptidyl-prolyl cis-trans isomerase